MQDALQELEIKVTFQDELLQRLDESLGQQQQEILRLRDQVRILAEEVRVLSESGPRPLAPEPPPRLRAAA
ncbi:MAG: SlyX family protein [Pseudomonadales bacterium]